MDSILDKVISSKEDQEKMEFDALDTVNVLLRFLQEKEADVLTRRFGFAEENTLTLEEVGKIYDVTRERIRQIEALAIKKIKASPEFIQVIKPVDHLALSLFTRYGGVLTKDFSYELFLAVKKDHKQSQQALDFLLSRIFDDKLEEIQHTPKYLPSWRLRISSLDFIDQVITVLENIIRTANKPLTFSQLYSELKKTPFYSANDQKLTEDAILAYFNFAASLDQNPFEEYGLARWGRIVPKRMHDRIYLILEKEGKPMHFRDIARRVAQIFKREAYSPTIHNELILNDDYVLVGRGIYALKKWGFKEGIVADVLEDILRSEGRPMTRQELVERVLAQRIVKKNTIHLALTDRSRFLKTADGKYIIAQKKDSKIQTQT